MWNGSITPFTKSFTDHFTIVSRVRDEITQIVDVTVEFDKTPGKQYLFSIPAARYSPDKESIGKEILRQIGE